MSTPLVEALGRILERADRVVLLRETDLGASCVDRGDIDLLIAAQEVPAVLDIIDEVAEQANIHYWLQRSGPHKVGVALFSADMRHWIRIDLWEQLWQIFGGRSYLTYEDVAPFVVDLGARVRRLPADLEAAVYVQHLATMGRDPSSPANSERIAGLIGRCEEHPELARALEGMLVSGKVDPKWSRAAEDHLRARCGNALEARGRATRRRTLLSRIHRRWLGNRTLDAVALVGVDGSGKTSLGDIVAERLGRDRLPTMSVYRRSLLFRAIYKASRLTVKLPYETLDKMLAPLTYVVTAWRLPKVVSAQAVLDRYLADFLIIDRKSDEPRLARCSQVLRKLDRPCQTIHIRAEWGTVASRKNEVTERGHAWYDSTTLRYYRSQPMVDYLAFRNDGPIGQASAALTEYLAHQRQQHR